MPGFLPVLGGTEKEARDKLAHARQLDRPEQGRSPMLSDRLGHDVSKYDLDGPLPELPASEQLQSRAKLLTDAARRDNLTLRQLAQMVATGRGHYVMCGTPEQIADRMEQWFREGGADGFNVMPPYFPGGLDDFAAGVIPILQKRGLFRTEYEGHDAARPFRLAAPAEPASAPPRRAAERAGLRTAIVRSSQHQDRPWPPRIVVVPPSFAEIAEIARKMAPAGFETGDRAPARPRLEAALGAGRIHGLLSEREDAGRVLSRRRRSSSCAAAQRRLRRRRPRGGAARQGAGLPTTAAPTRSRSPSTP